SGSAGASGATTGGRADPPAPPPNKVKLRGHREVTGGPRPRPRAAERIRRVPAEQGQGARPPRGDRRPAAAAPGGRADPPGPRARPRTAERIRRGPGRDHGRPSGSAASPPSKVKV